MGKIPQTKTPSRTLRQSEAGLAAPAGIASPKRFAKASRLEEILFASSEKSESRRITALLKEKQIRKIAPRIYTSNLKEPPAAIIKRNWYRILAGLFPEAILSHRSALEFKPTSKGFVFLTWSYPSKVRMPGLTVQLLKGPAAIEDDNLFF